MGDSHEMGNLSKVVCGAAKFLPKTQIHELLCGLSQLLVNIPDIDHLGTVS